MLANGFSTQQYDAMKRTTDPITSPDYLMGAFVSTSGSTSYETNKYLGGQLAGAHDWVTTDSEATHRSLKSSDIILTGTHTDTAKGGACNGLVNLMSGAAILPSQDGFTSKGLMKFDISGALNTTAGWTKRENILTSTKIIGFNGFNGPGPEITSDLQLKVDNPDVFNKYLDEEYVIFKLNSTIPSATTGSAATLGWGVATGSNGYTSIKLGEDSFASSNIVTFAVTTIVGGIATESSLGAKRTADDGSTKLITQGNISDLWIGPKKYWLNIYQPANKVPRSYQNFLVVQNVGSTGLVNTTPTVASLSGSTFNESIYGYSVSLASEVGQNGLYINTWNLATSEEDSSLVMNRDYGYGEYDTDTQEGGEIAKKTALPNQWLDLDMTKLATDSSTSPEESIIFRLGLTGDSSLNKVIIYSDEFGATTLEEYQRPSLLWEYKDELPKYKSPLRLHTNYDVLSGSGKDKVNLYDLDREELNAVKFTWEEEGDDILYRLLYIDTKPILDKYYGTYFHAPLNEIPGNDSKVSGSWYSGSSTAAGGYGNDGALNNNSVRRIDGPCGWGFDGDAETGVTYPSTDASLSWGWFNKNQATFIAHGVLNDQTTYTSGSMFSDMDATHGSFDIHYTKAASAGANVTPKITLASGATTYATKTVTVTSDYSFINDGESPLFVVATFNADLDTDHIKLYVNGFLVGSSDTNWVKGTALNAGGSYAGSIVLGCGLNNTNSRFRGIMSECMVHSKQLHVLTEPNEYILPTKYLPDMDSGIEIKYNSRLFLFDYHNIIGSSRDRVCMSTEATWEATGI
jgi:hypothetical protein